MNALKQECIKNERKNERTKERNNERKKERTKEKFYHAGWWDLDWKKIAIPYPKKYSKSPSVVHSIRASCENAAMFSCKKSNLAGKVPTSKEGKKICSIKIFFICSIHHANCWGLIVKKKLLDKNIFYLLYTPCQLLGLDCKKNILSPHQ